MVHNMNWAQLLNRCCYYWFALITDYTNWACLLYQLFNIVHMLNYIHTRGILLNPLSSIISSCVLRVWFLLTPCPSSTWKEDPLRKSFQTCAGTLPGWDGSSHRPCTAGSSTAAPRVESSLMMSSVLASRNQVISAGWCLENSIRDRSV